MTESKEVAVSKAGWKSVLRLGFYLAVVSGFIALSPSASGEDLVAQPLPPAVQKGQGSDPSSDVGKLAGDKTTAVKKGKTKKSKPEDVVSDAVETFKRGGVIMFVLLAVSVVGLTFVFERLMGLRKSAHVPKRLLPEVERKLREGGSDAVRLYLKGNESALARVLDGILVRKGATREEMERVLEDDTGKVLWDLRRNVRPVGVIASLAPLIGLLGTVFGLIKAFEKAAQLGMDDPKNFAEGIYVALYTTAFGLTIAIPLLICYHFLRGKADVIMREVEDIGIKFIVDNHDSAMFVHAPVISNEDDK